MLRDVDYAPLDLVVELDGKAFHDSSTARARDLDRDLATLVERGRTTLRLGHHQVVGAPCATATQVAAVLRRAGWTGRSTPCPACPDRA